MRAHILVGVLPSFLHGALVRAQYSVMGKIHRNVLVPMGKEYVYHAVPHPAHIQVVVIKYHAAYHEHRAQRHACEKCQPENDYPYVFIGHGRVDVHYGEHQPDKDVYREKRPRFKTRTGGDVSETGARKIGVEVFLHVLYALRRGNSCLPRLFFYILFLVVVTVHITLWTAPLPLSRP